MFTGQFTPVEPLLDAAIAAALRVMQLGQLHRYTAAPGELSDVAALEAEFATCAGARHALAVASRGYALATALRALGVGPGDRVLANALALSPVPGAIAALGAVPVFVGVSERRAIDLDDLAAKAGAARVLLLSRMRDHIADMDRLMRIADAAGLIVIEDCAHTMGARWNGAMSRRHGRIAACSTQTCKHLISG